VKYLHPVDFVDDIKRRVTSYPKPGSVNEMNARKKLFVLISRTFVSLAGSRFKNVSRLRRYYHPKGDSHCTHKSNCIWMSQRNVAPKRTLLRAVSPPIMTTNGLTKPSLSSCFRKYPKLLSWLWYGLSKLLVGQLDHSTRKSLEYQMTTVSKMINDHCNSVYTYKRVRMHYLDLKTFLKRYLHGGSTETCQKARFMVRLEYATTRTSRIGMF